MLTFTVFDDECSLYVGVHSRGVSKVNAQTGETGSTVIPGQGTMGLSMSIRRFSCFVILGFHFNIVYYSNRARFLDSVNSRIMVLGCT